MELHQMPYDSQPQTEAPVRARVGTVGLPEALKNIRQKIGTDPLAGVSHRNFGPGLDPSQTHLDPPALRRELDCVGKQIPHDLLKAARVAGRRAGSGIQFHFQLNAVGLGHGPDSVNRRFNDAPQVDRTEFQPQLASYDPRYVENLVDQLSLHPRIALDGFE